MKKSKELKTTQRIQMYKSINLRRLADSVYKSAQFSLCVWPSSHAPLKRLKESPGAFDNDALVVFDVAFEAFCLPPAVSPQTLQSSLQPRWLTMAITDLLAASDITTAINACQGMKSYHWISPTDCQMKQSGVGALSCWNAVVWLSQSLSTFGL